MKTDNEGQTLAGIGGSGGGRTVFGGNRSGRLVMSLEGGGGRRDREKEGNKEQRQKAADE